MLDQDIKKVVYAEKEIDEQTQKLAELLSNDYEDKLPLMVGILKGSIPFMANLVKRMTCQLEMDFMAVSSYHGGLESSGTVKLLKDLTTDIKDRHVVIVEDIIDSGRTLKAIAEMLSDRGAASVKIVTLLDKKEGRVVEIDADYVGLECPNEFVVGYGLDYDEKYRQLPYIGVLKPEVYSD